MKPEQLFILGLIVVPLAAYIVQFWAGLLRRFLGTALRQRPSIHTTAFTAEGYKED